MSNPMRGSIHRAFPLAVPLIAGFFLLAVMLIALIEIGLLA